MKNRRRLSTHIKNLSGRFNLKEENVRTYAKNNDLSEEMTERLVNVLKKNS